MIASHPFRRSLRLITPLLTLVLAACGAAEDDGAGGPPVYAGPVPGVPGATAAPGAAPGSNNPTIPPAATPSPAGAPPNGAPSVPPASNEGAPTGQVPVDGSMTAGSGTAPGGGAGGSASAGVGTSTPGGAAGAGMQPPPAEPAAPAEPAQPAPPPPLVLPTPPGAAFFFDDFESGAVDTQPAAWEHFISYITTASNEPSDTEFALLDNAESFRGAQSVHFHVERATAPAMLRLALPAGLSRVYVRAFVKTSIAVGGVQQDVVSNHETLIGLRRGGSGGDDEIRFGGAKGALGFNAVGPGRNDAVAPTQDLWSSGPGMQPGQWHCVELAFLADGTTRSTATLDGVVVRDVTSPAGWHIPVSDQWLSGLFQEVMIGWQSFSPAPANDVWMDDVVLSEEPIGCN